MRCLGGEILWRNVFWEKNFPHKTTLTKSALTMTTSWCTPSGLKIGDPTYYLRARSKQKTSKIPITIHGPWLSADYTCAKTKDERPNLYYAIQNPFTGQDVWPSTTRVWAFERTSTQLNLEQGLL